jgi:hypothetical protein
MMIINVRKQLKELLILFCVYVYFISCKKENYNRKKAIEIFNNAVSMHNKGSNIHDYQKAVSHFLSICHEANIVYEDR